MSAQIAKLRAARPEVTLLVLVPGPAAYALRERREIGWTDTLMVSIGQLTDERYLALAADTSEGVEGLSFWPDPLTSDLPAVQALPRAHEQVLPEERAGPALDGGLLRGDALHGGRAARRAAT